MLDELSQAPDATLGPLSKKAVAKGIAGVTVFLALSCASFLGVLFLWDEFATPYFEGAPVIYLNYGTLSLVGVFVTCTAFLVMAVTVWVGYFAGWTRRRVEQVQRYTAPFALLGLGLALGAWVLFGPLLSNELAANDYVRCDVLDSDIGINYYRRAYVKHPFLCVEKEQLPEQLALYERLAQAQLEGRLREAIIEAGMTVDEHGHIMRVPASRGQ